MEKEYRKTCIWTKLIEFQCPYCRKCAIVYGGWGYDGNLVKCKHCKRDVMLVKED